MNSPGLLGGAVAAPADPQAVQQAMRDRIRAERRARPARELEADAWGLAAVALEQPEIAAARCVAAYASAATAPGTAPLRRMLRASGVQLLLPVVLPDGNLDWSQEDGTGAPTLPLGRAAIARAQAVIVPALAVDSLGHRLGHGAGFYGRALRAVDATVPVFAVVHESEVLDAAVEPVPATPRDRPVDAVLTPHRCLRLSTADRHGTMTG